MDEAIVVSAATIAFVLRHRTTDLRKMDNPISLAPLYKSEASVPGTQALPSCADDIISAL